MSIRDSLSAHAYNMAYKDASLYMPVLEPLQHICLYYMLITKPVKCFLTYACNRDRRFPSMSSCNSIGLHLLHLL